ncbi:MAG: hypothetical protein Q4D52_01470 [Eubacteriales bacterium]|nr:hypothetical protein [Eubacteriales bacterium]
MKKRNGNRRRSYLLACLMLVTLLLWGGLEAKAAGGRWIKDSIGWWYSFYDGGYAKNEWEKIDGKWYHFNAGGYMESSRWIDDLYYVGRDGAMLVNTVTPDGYGVDKNGRYIPPRWVFDEDMQSWWYRNSDGSWPENTWKKIAGEWYYFGAGGYMYAGGTFHESNHTYVVDLHGRYLPWAKLPDPGYYQMISMYRSFEDYYEQYIMYYTVDGRILAIERNIITAALDPTPLAEWKAELRAINAYYGICAHLVEFKAWDQVRAHYYIQADQPAVVANAQNTYALGVVDIADPYNVWVGDLVGQLYDYGFQEMIYD